MQEGMAAGRYVAFVVLGGTKFSCSINSSGVPSRLLWHNSGLSRIAIDDI
jgi:hypothetical protein